MRARDFVPESADEEAWELVGQPVSEIQAFVRQIGMANDRRSVAKIASAIEATPDTSLPATSIPRLKNLANKPGDPEILRALQKISGQPDAAEHYVDLMARRDAGEGRDRGYDVSNLITAVRDGQYESPVLLRLPTGVYVIGGRTRLYAALALNVPIKVKIIGPQTFAKQGVAEGLDEMDKSAAQPGRDGRVSHSTYGSRDKKGSDYFKGKEAPGKPVTKKKMAKDALDILKKSGVAEGQKR